MLNQIIHGDCFEVLKDIPDNSINLICTDPPYFKVKKDHWDRQWDKPEHFLRWIDKAAEQWQRILKPNGSLYCFASPKMAAKVEVKLGERFNVLNHLIWNKNAEYLPGDSRATFLRCTDKNAQRIFNPATERIIFCEHYGAEDTGVLGEYLKKRRIETGLTCDAIEKATGHIDNKGRGSRLFYRWETGNSLPSEDDFCRALQVMGDIRPYPELRKQYEELRRPFSVSADVPYTDVWTFPTVSAYKGKHPCEKPLDMIKHIIKASSREGDLVLDPFCGSGTTALACKELNRNFICIEKEKEYFDIACDRLNQPREYSEEEEVIRPVKEVEFKQLSLFDIA